MLCLSDLYVTQFLSGGLEISLITAIDFTGSNGDPMEASSLHYISPTGESTAPSSCLGRLSAVSICSCAHVFLLSNGECTACTPVTCC